MAKLGEVYPSLVPEEGRYALPEHKQLFDQLYSLVQDREDLATDIGRNIVLIQSDFETVGLGHGDWSVVAQDYANLLAAGQGYQQWIRV